MTAHIITLSNKPHLLLEAIASVRAQTRQDLVHHVQADVGIDWGGRYPPAVYFNEQAALAGPADYVTWFSDDDLLQPRYVEVLAGYLDTHPDEGACYGWAVRHFMHPSKGEWEYSRYEFTCRWTAANPPCGRIDGGSVLVRRPVLDLIGYPYIPEDAGNGANICDGTFLDRVAECCGIAPVPEQVLTLRTTPWSAHMMIRDADYGLQSSNWRRKMKDGA